MGWIIFGVWIFLGIVANIFGWILRHSTEDEKDYKIASIVLQTIMWIGIAIIFALILYGIYLFWYYFCGGGLAFEVADNAGDAILYMLASLFVLVVVLGVIIGIFKK